MWVLKPLGALLSYSNQVHHYVICNACTPFILDSFSSSFLLTLSTSVFQKYKVSDFSIICLIVVVLLVGLNSSVCPRDFDSFFLNLLYLIVVGSGVFRFIGG